MVYTCSIIDLFDRFIVGYASGARIDNLIAIEALENALGNQSVKGNLILHSDQGSQFTSKYFTDYCKSRDITQSMSKAGCPQDNAVIERFFTPVSPLVSHAEAGVCLQK